MRQQKCFIIYTRGDLTLFTMEIADRAAADQWKLVNPDCRANVIEIEARSDAEGQLDVSINTL